MDSVGATSGPVRLLIADDHAFTRRGLRALLALVPSVDVVGEAEDGAAAVALAASLLPDVVLMDLEMPALGGIEATQAIMAAHPGTGVVVLTMHEDDASRAAAARAGAHAYLLKGTDGDGLVSAILAAGAR
jgi:DNA-binding NarL/FixJ family response regulator